MTPLLTPEHLFFHGSEEEQVEVDAAHWATESGVPIDTVEMLAALVARWPQWGAPTAALNVEMLRSVSTLFSDLLHHQYRPQFTRFAQRYAELDPDRDTRPIHPVAAPAASPDSQPAASPDSQPAASTESSPAAAESDPLLPAAGTKGLAAEGPDAAAGATVGATVGQASLADTAADVQKIAQAGKQVLLDAAYSEISRQQLETAVAECTPWGVPLHVEFDVFDAVLMFARGDVIGQRTLRYWRNWFRLTTFDVPMYQRVVVMFKLRPGYRTEDNLDDRLLHLRLFKNIPRQDIDMLLPGTSIRFSWYDHLRNVGPTLGGVGWTLFRIGRLAMVVAVVTLNIAVALTGLGIVLIGYLARSVINHRNAKNRYMLNLNRNLYHQKLDTNAGVAFRLIQEAETQRHRELLLAYYALLSAGQPLSPRRLQRRVERMVRELVDLDIRFRAKAALEQLRHWDIVQDAADGKVSCQPLAETLAALREHWDRQHVP